MNTVIPAEAVEVVTRAVRDALDRGCDSEQYDRLFNEAGYAATVLMNIARGGRQ